MVGSNNSGPVYVKLTSDLLTNSEFSGKYFDQVSSVDRTKTQISLEYKCETRAFSFPQINGEVEGGEEGEELSFIGNLFG